MKIRGRQVCALLDTGAKVNVMDTQTMDDMGLRKYLEPEANHIYGVSGTPISMIGSIELPIKVPGEGTRWTRVHVLVGEEQSLLLGRQFLQLFSKVVFNWNDTVTYQKYLYRPELPLIFLHIYLLIIESTH